MKILILNWKDIKHPQVGGAEIIVYELAKRLVKKGHSVTWFCRSFKYCKPEDEIDGIKIVRKGNLLTTYLHAPIFYWKLKSKPDVVIDMSNTIYWQTPLWAFKSKRLAYLNQLAKNVFYYEYPVLISRLGIFFERIQYIPYIFSKFICYANSTKSDLISMGIREKNIKLFSLGIDHNRYSPGIKSSKPLFICVNRLVKMKRTELAIMAINHLKKRYPNIHLVIIGYGYDRKRLEMLRDGLDLQKYVTFADENVLFFNKSNKDKKVFYMQKAWALIFPSVKEGWGMTVTESAACGTPSIVSGVTGLVDSVKNNVTGIILDRDPSSYQIARAMEKIIKSKFYRTRLSKNARDFSKQFTWEKSVSEFEKLLYGN